MANCVKQCGRTAKVKMLTQAGWEETCAGCAWTMPDAARRTSRVIISSLPQRDRKLVRREEAGR